MPSFYVTFGQKYFHEPHPADERIDPDGWVRVDASDMAEARYKTFAAFGERFCHVYDKDRFISSYFPRGELFSI